MKFFRFNWFIFVLSAAMSAFGFWSFLNTLSPIPQPMHTASGTVASAEASSRKGRISIIRFKVAPSGQEFAYPDILKNTKGVWAAIDRGLPVEVRYTNPEKPELWGLRVAGKTLVTPDSAYRARRENGYWGLALGVGFFASCLYLLFVEGRRHLRNFPSRRDDARGLTEALGVKGKIVREPSTESLFLRIPSRSEKSITLVASAFLCALCFSIPMFMGINLKTFQDWIILYGIAFFAATTRHSWLSIKHNWSIQQDNDAIRSPLAVLQSKWTMLLLAGLWLLAWYSLP